MKIRITFEPNAKFSVNFRLVSEITAAVLARSPHDASVAYKDVFYGINDAAQAVEIMEIYSDPLLKEQLLQNWFLEKGYVGINPSMDHGYGFFYLYDETKTPATVFCHEVYRPWFYKLFLSLYHNFEIRGLGELTVSPFTKRDPEARALIEKTSPLRIPLRIQAKSEGSELFFGNDAMAYLASASPYYF